MAGNITIGGLYKNKLNGDVLKLEGRSSRYAILGRHDSFLSQESYEKLPWQEFLDNWEDYNVHDHTAFCCAEHNHHTSPHRGCLLR